MSENPDKPYWRVAVSIDGEEVLAIEPGMLAGIPDIEKYAHEVRQAGQHLLAFIGPEEPYEMFFPPEDAA